jgi:hypothetical protein
VSRIRKSSGSESGFPLDDFQLIANVEGSRIGVRQPKYTKERSMKAMLAIGAVV